MKSKKTKIKEVDLRFLDPRIDPNKIGKTTHYLRKKTFKHSI